MADEVPDPASAITQPPAYCTTTPVPGTYLTAPCPDCAHATVLHIGVEHCPVCELVELNRRARDLLDHGRIEIAIHGQPVDDQYIERLLLRQALRNGHAPR